MDHETPSGSESETPSIKTGRIAGYLAALNFRGANKAQRTTRRLAAERRKIENTLAKGKMPKMPGGFHVVYDTRDTRNTNVVDYVQHFVNRQIPLLPPSYRMRTTQRTNLTSYRKLLAARQVSDTVETAAYYSSHAADDLEEACGAFADTLDDLLGSIDGAEKGYMRQDVITEGTVAIGALTKMAYPDFGPRQLGVLQQANTNLVFGPIVQSYGHTLQQFQDPFYGR